MTFYQELVSGKAEIGFEDSHVIAGKIGEITDPNIGITYPHHFADELEDFLGGNSFLPGEENFSFDFIGDFFREQAHSASINSPTVRSRFVNPRVKFGALIVFPAAAFLNYF